MLCGFVTAVIGQGKYYTKTGKIKFDANTPNSPDKVEAVTNSAVCVLDTKSGAIQFSVVVNGFQFEKALMQEHFNENYLESAKFPKAEFKGTIGNNHEVNYTKDGVYKVKVSGGLTIHGVTKQVDTEGELTIKNGRILAKAGFEVLLSDYQVKIPGVVADKVAKSAKIMVECNLEVLNK